MKTNLQDIQVAVSDAAKKNLPPAIGEDKINAVLFEDGVFYRGLIYKIEGTSHHVELIDFGNTLQTTADKMRGLPASLSTMESPTMGCRLYGLDKSKMNDAALITQLTNMVEVQTLYELVGEEDGVSLVMIWDTKDQLIGSNLMGSSTVKTSAATVLENGYHFSLDDLHYKENYKIGSKIPAVVGFVTDPELIHLTHGTESVVGKLDALFYRLYLPFPSLCQSLIPRLFILRKPELSGCRAALTAKKIIRAPVVQVRTCGFSVAESR